MAYTKSSNFAKMFCAKTPFKKGTFWSDLKKKATEAGKTIKNQFTDQSRRNLNLGRDKEGKII
tara:strand:- start:281 stop:469 length:189 start_codon:yes stop_codon:yes gene_type:complete